VGGALPVAALVALFEQGGFVVSVLHRERNARTGNAASIVLTLQAVKPA
jgi:hypothetical protein